MERVVLTDSIDISVNPARVFDLVTNFEKRLRLSPHWEVVRVRKLTEGLPGVGTKYSVRLRGREEDVEYTTEWVELKHREKLVSCSQDGNFEVTMTLKRLNGGTRLEYREVAFIPEGKAYRLREAKTVLHNLLNNMKKYLEAEKKFGGGFLRLLWDRVWLRMSPWERNVSKLILIMEGALLATAILILIVIAGANYFGILSGG